ncbi:Zn-ribbon domain-containing OB-fold protein [Hydrogenophaga sp.]|uniref:Zn-ribbon domain-containing OB-fold protein n=1 Tax=Hydrogenophaga sp. TaxID=1904254 RepID=UPI002716E509|nr:zinc ribbon domain-containing protein [Hydrogenophaga sp.]MDO9435950.1 zinc ribbon domain-containing protein [Hydrogenophaga sp.]
MSNEQTKPSSPVPISEEVRPYFDAASEGRLLVKHCRDCGKYHHYPRAICPHCASDQTEWTQASGRGSIYSFAIASKATGGVHVLAYVTLDDCEVTMLTNILTDTPNLLSIGAPVQAVFHPGTDGIPVPMFSLTPNT